MHSSVLIVLLSGGVESVADPREADRTPERASAEEPRLGVRSEGAAGALPLLRASMKTHTPAGPTLRSLAGQRRLSEAGRSRWSGLGDGSPIHLERDAS